MQGFLFLGHGNGRKVRSFNGKRGNKMTTQGKALNRFQT
jgi:hypothetical protein